MPVPQISNPAGANGYTSLQTNLGYATSDFVALTDIPAKTAVTIDVAGRVGIAATTATTLTVGVTLKAVTAGNVVQVIVSGIAEGVPAQGAIAAGALVINSGSTAGAVASAATPAAGTTVGVAISAAAGGVVNLWLKR